MEKPWKVILAFLGVFVAGAVFGGFFSIGIGRRIWEMETPAPAPAKPVAVTVTPTPAQPAPPTAAKGAPSQVAAKAAPAQQPVPVDVERVQLMRRVTNRLNLTATQKALVEPIIQRAVQDIWRQQQNYYRETQFLTQRMKQDIAKELTPEQQVRLEDLWAKQLELFRKRQVEAQAQIRQQNQAAQKAPTPAPSTPADKSLPEKPVSTDPAKPAAPAPEAKDQPASKDSSAPAPKPAGGA